MGLGVATNFKIGWRGFVFMSGDHGRDRFYTIKLQNNLLSRATNISKFARHIWIGGLNDKAHSAAIDGNSPDKITADKVATIRQL